MLYYAELKNGLLKLAFGEDSQDAVEKAVEKWDDQLLAVYQDNGNCPFIKIFQEDDL